MKFFEDLFMGLGNNRWELARVAGGWAIFTFSLLPIGEFIRGSHAIDYSSVGVGFAAVMGGAAALIFAKDTARTNAVSQVSKDATDAAAAAQPVTKVAGDLNAENVEKVEVTG